MSLYREESDKNHTYSVVTRVPVGFQDKLLCQRLDQSYAVGPLLVNREAVLKTTTSLSNNRTIYTDNNGYQMMKREYKKYINNVLSRVSTRRTPALLSSIDQVNYVLGLCLCVCLSSLCVCAELLSNGTRSIY